MTFDGFSFSDVAGAFSPNPNAKPVFKSKTILFNAILAVAALIPPVNDWMKGHLAFTIQVLTYGNVLLRLVTKSKISLYNE